MTGAFSCKWGPQQNASFDATASNYRRPARAGLTEGRGNQFFRRFQAIGPIACPVDEFENHVGSNAFNVPIAPSFKQADRRGSESCHRTREFLFRRVRHA